MDTTEQTLNGKLFQTAAPVTEENVSPKVFLFVDGTQKVELSDGERNCTEDLFFCSYSDRCLSYGGGDVA